MAGYPHLSQIQDPVLRSAIQDLYRQTDPIPSRLTADRTRALVPASVQGRSQTALRESRVTHILDGVDPTDGVSLRQLRAAFAAAGSGGGGGSTGRFVRGPSPAASTDGYAALWDGSGGRQVEVGGIIPSATPTRLFRRSFTSAELTTLNTVPITLSLGAGGLALVVMWVFFLDVTVVFTNSPTVSIRWAGSTTHLLAGQIAVSWQSVAQRLSYAHMADNNFTNTDVFQPIGDTVRIRSSANATGGGTATASLALWYIDLSVTTPAALACP